ncbi:MAG: aminoacyl-tRNA hydrolase [Rhodospirillaceae bacterium]|nr:aminoacyl-tRNA hydrolase [Rhodospirillaceae bacterium]
MRLLVGLGNPGKDYRLNRHNIGFMALDIIAGRYRLSPWRSRFQADMCEGEVGDRVIALKPTTYMNRSGQAVGEAARFYKIAPENVIVIYDEIELAPGKVKVKLGGGSAGHNGIKSIDEHIGNNYWRVRLGVGRPESKDQVSNHVLDNFAKGDTVWLGPLLDAVADAAPLLVAGDENKFMTKVALMTKPPPEKKLAEKPEKNPAEKKAAPTESD